MDETATPTETNWIIETKGRVWEGTDAKDAVIADWCKKVSAQTKTAWRYKRIDQIVFGASNLPTFTDLLTAARQHADNAPAGRNPSQKSSAPPDGI